MGYGIAEPVAQRLVGDDADQVRVQLAALPDRLSAGPTKNVAGLLRRAIEGRWSPPTITTPAGPVAPRADDRSPEERRIEYLERQITLVGDAVDLAELQDELDRLRARQKAEAA